LPSHHASNAPFRLPSLPLLLAAAALAVVLSACQSEVVCASGEIVLDGRCVSLQSDPQNCGEIGRACGTGESCSAGLCCLGSQCPPAVYAACFNTNSLQGMTPAAAPVGAPLGLDEGGPMALAWRGAEIWVANSMSNTLDRLAASPAGLAPVGPLPSITIPLAAGYADLEAIAEKDGLLYVANAAVGSLVIVDPSRGSPIVGEVMLGGSSSPQGIAIQGGKAYVTLRAANEIAVVDLANHSVTRRVSVSALASVGASAMPGRIVVSGDRAYAVLWNLDPYTDPFIWSPGGNGRLAVLDTSTDALVPAASPVDLGASCLNPGGLAVEGSTLWVTCGYQKYDPSGGQPFQGASFVPVDISGAVPVVGAPVPAGAYGPGPIAFCNGVGYAGDRYSGSILRLDPTARSVIGASPVCPASAYGFAMVADVICGR
jgi:DNA-binding beta-propeller fold protein YncE